MLSTKAFFMGCPSVNHREQNDDGDIRMRPGYVNRLLILLIFTNNM